MTMCNDSKCPLNRNGIKHDVEDSQIHVGPDIMMRCW